MKLEWVKRSNDTLALTGTLKGKEYTFGWLMPKRWSFNETGYVADWYEVGIAGMLHKGVMPCEDERYVTVRQAMRALHETVTVLLIGRGHET